MEKVPMKVNAFDFIRGANTQLLPLFPYPGPGAIVPCCAAFESDGSGTNNHPDFVCPSQLYQHDAGFFLISWLPSLLAYRGLANSASLSATSLFNASGVIGGVSMAFARRRLIPPTVLSVAYLCAAASVIALAVLSETGSAFLVTIAISGAAILGSQFCLIALVNHYYPPPRSG